jgi:hypothetical protein
MAYKWTGSQTLRRVGDTDIQPGEVFEPTDAELESFGGKIETVATDDGDEVEPESTDASEDTDYSEMDYAELRQLATEADTDEIDGRSKKAEIIAYFEE